MATLKETLSVRVLADYSEEVSRFVYNIFQKAFDFNSNSEVLDEIKKDDIANFPYSSTLIVFDASEAIMFGTIKAVFKGISNLLPIERDFTLDCADVLAANGLPYGEMAEIARLAVDHSVCRSHGRHSNEISLLLLEKVCLEIKKRKIPYCFAAIDESVWQWLVRIGFPFKLIGTPKFYLGSNTVPVLLKTAEITSPLWEFCDK